MRYPDGGGLHAAERDRREQVRLQYRPDLLDGFIASRSLDLTPFCNPQLEIFSWLPVGAECGFGLH
jgi:hypothetical protein